MITDKQCIPLAVPVPPMLEQALGYPGPLSRPGVPSARYVAFYWTEGGDEAVFDDGQHAGVGLLSNDACLAFVRHSVVAPHLQRYNLGSSEEPADHWLILDRQQQQFSVAPIAVASRLVEEQWEPQSQSQDGPLVVTPEDIQRDLDAFQQMHASWMETTTTGSGEAIMQAMQAERQQCDELVAWLDAHGLKQHERTE